MWRLAPALSESELTVGELAWGTRQHVGGEPESRRRLWLDGGRVVAYRSVEFRELTRTVPFVKEVAGVVRPRA